MSRSSQSYRDEREGANTIAHTYDDASNVATVSYPNGVQSVMTYDTLNRLTGLATQNSGYVYQRGTTGNLTSATELNGRTANWTYDGIYRLNNETISLAPSGKNGTVSYGLDPVGNRLSDTSSLAGVPSGSWNFNADDELSSETYDQNGNVLSTGGKTFAYDFENHLMSMGGTVALLYDGDGNRVGKSVNGVVTRYLVDDLNPTGYPQVVEELSGAGVVTRQYTFGLQRINENQMLNGSWTPSFYGYDGGGSVRQLTNAAGAITDTYEYDAFGNASFTNPAQRRTTTSIAANSTTPTSASTTSAPDTITRQQGRFMSRDPKGGSPLYPNAFNRYLYTNGDPINVIDPSGRSAFWVYAGITAYTVTVGGYALHKSGACLNENFTYVARPTHRAGYKPQHAAAYWGVHRRYSWDCSMAIPWPADMGLVLTKRDIG